MFGQSPTWTFRQPLPRGLSAELASSPFSGIAPTRRACLKWLTHVSLGGYRRRPRPVYDCSSCCAFSTAGESHGKGLVVTIEGLPAGLSVDAEYISEELARRRLGYGRGPRMRFEADELTLLGGIRHGRTLGSPVAIEIGNSEWPKWVEEMSPAPGQTTKPLTQPRPGHADLAGMQKYALPEARDVLERASARETAARVAGGSLCKLLLRQLGIEIVSHVVQMGPVVAKGGRLPGPERPGGGRPVSREVFRPRNRGRDGRGHQGGGQGWGFAGRGG